MKKSNISAIVMVALVGAAYVSSTLKNESIDVAPPISGSHACDPNYSGCVPIATDVDCAGGPGNGPEYVEGPITVIGQDIYKMDGDGDGIACE